MVVEGPGVRSQRVAACWNSPTAECADEVCGPQPTVPEPATLAARRSSGFRRHVYHVSP